MESQIIGLMDTAFFSTQLGEVYILSTLMMEPIMRLIQHDLAKRCWMPACAFSFKLIRCLLTRLIKPQESVFRISTQGWVLCTLENQSSSTNDTYCDMHWHHVRYLFILLLWVLIV